MGPDEALRRIAYLLEAQGAPTYKVQAFRRAASTVDDLAPAELARLDEHGRLETLPGVGKSTATVISEALSGSVPRYLQALEENAPVLPPGPVRSLFESLRGDCHSHSDWSDGGSTIFEMAWAARDAWPRLPGPDRPQPAPDGRPRSRAPTTSAASSRSLAGVNEDLAPFRLLTGIEVDILDDGALDQEEALLNRLDVVVASVHSKLRMERRAMTRRLVAAVENPLVDILGHCTGGSCGPGPPPSSFDPEAVFARLPGQRHRRRGQLPARAPRPARGSPKAAQPRLPLRHRHRRPRAGPALVAHPGVRAGGGGRDPG